MTLANPALPGNGITTRILRDDGATFLGITLPTELYSIAAASSRLVGAAGITATEIARVGALRLPTNHSAPTFTVQEGPGWSIQRGVSQTTAYIVRDDGKTHLSYSFANTGFVVGRAATALSGSTGITAGELLRVQAMLGASVSAAPAQSIIASVAADGFTVQPVTPAANYFPDNPALRQVQTVTDKGYNSSGALSDFTDRPITLTMNARLIPFQNGNASDFGQNDNVAGVPTGKAISSRTILATTTASGMVNASTIIAPKPTSAAITTDRMTVRNDGSGHWYLKVQWSAFAYFWRGKQTVPYGRYRATDSAGTVFPWRDMVWNPQFTGMGDQFSTCGMETPGNGEDLAACADGLGFLDWEIYPAFGDNRSIRSTLDSGTRPRNVKPYFFRKSSVAPTMFYLSSTGSDAADGSSATPFASVGRFLNASQALGAREDCILNLKDSCLWGTTVVTADGAANAYVTIQKDPAAAPGQITLTLPSAAQFNTRSKYVRFVGAELKVVRGGAQFFNALAGGRFCFDGVSLDNGSFNVAWTGTATEFHFVGGGELLNYATNVFSDGPNMQVTLMRGLKMLYATGAGLGIGMLCVFGCNFNGIFRNVGGTGANAAAYDGSGFIAAFSRITGGGSASGADTLLACVASGQSLLDGMAIVCCELDWGRSVSGAMLGISRDPPGLFSTHGVIEDSNTYAGAGIAGRKNSDYDNNSTVSGSATVVRTHTCWHLRNPLVGQDNIKGGQFVGANDLDTVNAPLHIGNLAGIYGVDVENYVILYVDAAGGSANGSYLNNFSRLYAGLNAFVGASTSSRTDVWVSTTGLAQWSGGATYANGDGTPTDLRVKSLSSPQANRVPSASLPYSLGGESTGSGTWHSGCRGLTA